MAAKDSVLIVGAGAVGLVVGYHLALGGTDVTFFVRPSRRESVRGPQRLYCYDDGQLKELSGHAVVTSLDELAGRRFDYVLFTPDASACYSSDGERLLRGIGAAIRDSDATFILVAVGIGLRDHVLAMTGLSPDRLIEGTLANAAHQTSANLPQHPPTDSAVVAQAVVAYRHFPNRAGFMVVPAPRERAQRFVALYNRCGVSVCITSPANLYRLYTNAFFCYTLASEMMGWPRSAALTKHGATLRLAIRAAKEIAGMREFGWVGFLVKFILSEKLLVKMMTKYERDLCPLDFVAFNRFHHGDKVLAQDVDVLRRCLAAGQAQGRAMSALGELLSSYDTQTQNYKGSLA